MLVPTEWLREYCDPPLDTAQLAARLTLTGTKDERSLRYGAPSADHYVVGFVRSVARHPNADRLSVCEVDVGEAGPVTIVCGAPNVTAGQTVAVARPGAVLPDGRTLTAAKLRGVTSDGMILSQDELALGGDHSGILVLADGPKPGSPLSDVLPLGTDVIEFEITPNRPDCLGVYGIAREVHASTGAPLAPPPWQDDPGSVDGDAAGVAITVECPDLCPRFMARAFENITLGPSPLWLQARLLAAGMRPISNVVDIANYVMLLTGQPLHTFDLDKIAGSQLTIRRARTGESMDTLDGVTRTLDEELVVIYDADGPTSIAAIMGGEHSEVSETTTRVLLESATWNGANIQRSAVRLGLRSEASSRYEKGLSPGQAAEAIAVATRLLIDLTGAIAVPGTIDIGGPGPDAPPIELKPEHVSRLLGAEIPAERCAEILTALGFTVAPSNGTMGISVPHYRRRDITREVDLIEEVARIDGLDRLPATLPPRNGAAGRLSHAQLVRRRVEDALAARGLHEIVGWSFADPALLDALRLAADDPLRAVVTIENPLSGSQSIMRPTLLGSLLDAARYNRSHGARDVKIFESANVYRTSKPLADEHHALGILLAGAATAESWGGQERTEADFFTARALLEAVLGVAGVRWTLERAQWPFLHPGRSASVVAGDVPLGFIGELHPQVAALWELGRTAVWVIDLGLVTAAAPLGSAYVPFGSFPAANEDLAVLVSDEVAADEVIAVVRDAGGAELESVELFDVYTGEQVGVGLRSLALHLGFRAADRTLSAEEIATARAAIAAALASKVGGELRA